MVKKPLIQAILLMLTSPLSKCFFLLIAVTIMGRLSQADEYRLSAEYRAMDGGWSFLPAVPASFQSAKDLNFSLGAEFERFGLEIGRSNLDLDLVRSVEPIDVSLSAKKDFLTVFHKLSDYRKITLSVSRQGADQQRFACYDFSGITIGSCEAADVQVGSIKPKYDVLEEDLVGISANTKTIGISFSQVTNSRWLDYFSVGLFSTTHDYNWLTPVEDLESPFILGLVFNGKTLGDSITEAFKKFPQRDSWRLNQLNISGSKAVPIYEGIEIFADGDLIYLNYSDYSAVIAAPNYNLKLKAGFRLVTDSVVFELYCNYYHNNLIGFEPITFNQRTEHYFDRSYGNVGIKAEIRF